MCNKTRVSPQHKARVNANMRLVPYEKGIFVESVSVFTSSRKDGCRFIVEDTTRSGILCFGEGNGFLSGKSQGILKSDVCSNYSVC